MSGAKRKQSVNQSSKTASNYIKQMDLSLSDSKGILPVAHALSSELRLDILLLTGKATMSVSELAQELKVPLSTVAINVSVLENAGLLSSHQVPGTRGLKRRCTRVTDYVSISLISNAAHHEHVGEMSLPVGGFSQCGDILSTCGLADCDGFIGIQDQPLNFYLPERLGAQILWFRQGYVEYRFPILPLRDTRLKKIEFAFEACSEAIGYDNHCPSDISVEVNGVSLGFWRSPGDFGGRNGLLNPSWWPTSNTQFGLLKTWAIDQIGTTLDGQSQAGVSLDDLGLDRANYLSLRIGVNPDSEYVGGLNLFGKGFGDFPIDIVLRYYIS